MTDLTGTKLLNIVIDMETYNKLQQMKGKGTWLDFLQRVSNNHASEPVDIISFEDRIAQLEHDLSAMTMLKDKWKAIAEEKTGAK